MPRQLGISSSSCLQHYNMMDPQSYFGGETCPGFVDGSKGSAHRTLSLMPDKTCPLYGKGCRGILQKVLT
jgi:hypothetical protein